MKSLTLWIFSMVVMTTAQFPRSEYPACVKQCQCGPGTSGTFDFTCPVMADSLINVKYMATKYLQIICSPGMTVSDFGLLEGVKLGPVKAVTLQMCPMPESLSKLLESFNVTELMVLTLRNSNLTNILDTNFLSGVANISRLAITSSGASNLPADFFRNVPDLTFLDLRDNDMTELPSGIFDSIPKLSYLELGGNKITNLNPTIFQKQNKLKFLNLWKNSMQNLTRKVFENLSELESLDVHSNGLLSLPNDIFADMRALKNLSLASNNFSTLPKEVFSGMPQMEKLILNDNRQRLSLPSGLLSNMTNLTTVSMKSNNISELPEDLLWGCTSLKTLDIQRNALTELPDALFKDTTSLQMLDISNNRLQSLSKQTFSTLAQLKILTLENNRLSNIPEFAFGNLVKLEELNLDRNELSLIETLVFPNKCQLKKVRLSHNRLTFEQDQLFRDPTPSSPLYNCRKLEKIHLANNSIREIFFDWRSLMPQLSELNLAHNNITYIESGHLQFLVNKQLILDLSNNKIGDINLSYLGILVISDPPAPGHVVQSVKVLLKNNPLQCNCQTYDLLRYIERKLEPEVYQFVELVTDGLNCLSPEDLSGVSVSKLKSTTITCELDSAKMGAEKCTNSCKCYGRPYDRTLIIDCENKGLQVPPVRLPQLPIYNRTELNLDRNWLQSLPNVSLPGYHRVARLSVSHNNLTRLESANIPPRIELLKLDHNNLTHIDAATLDFLANVTTLQLIHLYSNPWDCNCDARDLLNFIQARYQQVDMLQNVTCNDGRSLSQLSADDLCPLSTTIIIAASVTIAVLGIAIGLLAALYYRYQQEVKVWLYAHNLCLWFVTEEELDRDKHYDAFISYSHKDEEFVVERLVPGLESGPTPFKLCLHYRDWIAGDWIPSQIARSVEDSRRTVVILSPNFLESVWGRMEFRAAHSQALSEGRARVIVVLFGDVGPIEDLDPELRAYLSMNTYVKWGDPWFWDKLRYALPHPPELVKRATAISKQPELRIMTGFGDKLDLMAPTTPNATTPPANKIIDPMLDANGHIIIPLTATNGHVQLLKESNGHLNGYVKSV